MPMRSWTVGSFLSDTRASVPVSGKRQEPTEGTPKESFGSTSSRRGILQQLHELPGRQVKDSIPGETQRANQISPHTQQHTSRHGTRNRSNPRKLPEARWNDRDPPHAPEIYGRTRGHPGTEGHADLGSRGDAEYGDPDPCTSSRQRQVLGRSSRGLVKRTRQ